MHGAGNDFVMIDLVSQRGKLRPRDIRHIADRHFGIGCDQVLVVEPPGNPEVDFRYRIFNADGDEVEQCGNGARCFARFVRDRKLTAKRHLRVETCAGILELRVQDRHQVEVNMGVPALAPSEVPITAAARSDDYPITVDGQDLRVGAVSMGNPHAILRVDDTDAAPVATLGPAIERHPDFPKRANAGFMQVCSDSEIRLRVFERGVGETLACGSGACAAVVFGRLRGWLSETVTVHLPGGKLSVSWGGEGQPVMMTGPTAVVFEGSIRI
jgi:diaminopimelate epimerase